MTIKFTAAVAGPPGPLAVNVYVVLAVGETLVEPVSATEPMPLLMLQDVALVVVQLRVEIPPDVVLVGFAANESILTLGEEVTVTVTCCITGPPGPFAVSL